MARLLAVLLALALAAPAGLIAQEKQQKPRAEAAKKKAKKAAQKKRAKKAEKRSASGGQTAPAAGPAPAAKSTDLGFEAERDEARIRRRRGLSQPAKPLNSGNADDPGE